MLFLLVGEVVFFLRLWEAFGEGFGEALGEALVATFGDEAFLPALAEFFAIVQGHMYHFNNKNDRLRKFCWYGLVYSLSHFWIYGMANLFGCIEVFLKPLHPYKYYTIIELLWKEGIFGGHSNLYYRLAKSYELLILKWHN